MTTCLSCGAFLDEDPHYDFCPEVSEIGNSERVNFYSPHWSFAKVTTMGILRRFVKIWGGYIIQDSDYGLIFNVVVKDIEIGWFTR